MDSEIWRVIVTILHDFGIPGFLGAVLFYIWRISRDRVSMESRYNDLVSRQLAIEEKLLGVIQANTEAVKQLDGSLQIMSKELMTPKEFKNLIVLYTQKLTQIETLMGSIKQDVQELLRRGF